MPDHNCYPTDTEIELLQDFEGSPRAFVETMAAAWPGYGTFEFTLQPSEDGAGAQEWVLALTTGGWSGCEEIQSVVESTMFGILYYAAWKRGGYHEYRIATDRVEVPMFLGDPLRRFKDEAAS